MKFVLINLIGLNLILVASVNETPFRRDILHPHYHAQPDSVCTHLSPRNFSITQPYHFRVGKYNMLSF
jgi:hypothetical protein